MKTEELKRWKTELLSELEAEREKALNAIDVKYNRKLAALDVLLEDDKNISGRTQPVVSLGEEYRKSLTKLSAAREAISHTPNSFTTAKLFVYVSHKYPNLVEKPADLSNSVWMLKGTGEVEVVKKGGGPENPTEYRTTTKFRPASGSGV